MSEEIDPTTSVPATAPALLAALVSFEAPGLLSGVVGVAVTGVLARLLTRHGNRVGAVLKGPDQSAHAQVIPVRGGRRHRGPAAG